MIDPEDLAAFQAAVADIKPLPPVNRVHLTKPPRPVSARPLASEKSPPAQKKRRNETLPAHWNSAAESPTTNPDSKLEPDLAAFRAAMAGVQPLPSPNLVQHGTCPPPPRPLQHIADEQAALHESLHGHIGLQDRLEGGDEPHHLRTGLAQNVLRDLRRGRWVVQNEIDLHGLNRDEARQLLATFLAICLHREQRCVRVVHGKGLGSPQKLSILRQLVRGWLAQREEVLAYCQAKPHDGGEGALLVLLRAPKKQRAT
uniref:Smr protein/MutS2 C-terminal n=1 Tax=Dechloromonas aromatica (strain RCB) TaxID=159087 RepID=Q47GI7_DECAR